MKLSGGQIRGGRGLLGISRDELAKEADVSVETVKRLETTAGELSANVQTINAIVDALRRLGVLLVDENGEGPGVRLRKERG